MWKSDWTTDAANEILRREISVGFDGRSRSWTCWDDADAEARLDHRYAESARQEIIAVIQAHCPMEPETAYMKVPRCDTCNWWRRHHAATMAPIERFGDCRYDGGSASIDSTREDFGCVQWKEKV